MIGSSTRLVAMIGTPIIQARSPRNFNRYFDARNEDRAMIPVDLRPEQVADFVAAARGWDNLDGFVVTIPHKTAVAGLVDDMTPRAKFLGAVNVVRRHPDGRLSGDMTDGEGFLLAARANGFDAADKTALVVGAGGAGRAIGHALAEAGLSELFIHDVDEAAANSLCSRLKEAFPSLAVAAGSIPQRRFDLVVNASPCGMGGNDPLPVPEEVIKAINPGGLAADVVTSPERTRFLELAAHHGVKIQFGHQMAGAQMEALGRAMGVMGADAND
ncbi:shikimate dehydrogenase [Rhizobium sp. NTR19]|uniref:Shikimate dehydrogenase n=1 Tax=Neorhizobium turbinariae TaxID=2937795 RepID=A0ABT0INN9_9HYPH|nr:shikimate dehydrogenase [Neorhizobium turbinariae]MCK8779502.1 shikimate dehydrogenase [Neorhizobium turbinariae]